MLGGVAVHGIHLVLWVLDHLVAQSSLSGFERLRVYFDRAATVDEEISLNWRDEGDRFLAKLSAGTGTIARISVTPSNRRADHWTGSEGPSTEGCELHEFDQLSRRSGQLPLTLPVHWKKSFPHLADRFSASQVAVLLASTRLVGMICPGLHSIYSSLQLECIENPDSKDALRYEVTRADRRVRLIDMAIGGAGLRGSVTAFMRPLPCKQPAFVDLMSQVAPDAFAGQRAIVIGGSRGLGELTAKLLCIGGAMVTITWRQGKSDADAIAGEAAALGRNIAVMPFDVVAPPNDQPPDGLFTHLYYFATPRISAGRPGQFEPALFTRLVAAYVTGLARCTTWFAARCSTNACIWYPSTIFLEQPDPNFAEYTAAKACGEALCTQLGSQLAPLRFVVARLPRVATDQTQALTELPMSNGTAIMRSALLSMARR